MRKLFIFFSIIILFVSLASAAFSDNYAYKKNISINQSQLVESLIDFPLLINIYDSDLKNLALTNGNDILFATDDNSKLDYQIESFNISYNSTHANLIAWVKVNLTNATNNVIWMYFNYTNSTNRESRNVWSDGYKGVYHLSESSGSIFDSGLYSHNSTAIGGTPDYSQTGKIGKSLNFNSASNEFINFGDVSDYDFTSEYSVSAWFKTSQSAQYAGICGKLTTSPAYGYSLQVHLGGSQVWIGNGSYFAPLGNSTNDNVWHHFYLVRTGNNNSFYIDGVYQKSTIVNGTLASTSGFYIGSWGDTTYDFTGLVDEVVLANKTRSTGFITTSFRNQNNTNAFYSLGALLSTSSSQSNDLVSFSNFSENPSDNSIYASNQNYIFNVTINGNNGTSWLEFNSIIYNSLNLSNIFTSLVNDLPAGSYSYRWWTFSNETTNNLTSSSSRNYAVNKAESTISLRLNGASNNLSINRGENITINCTRLTGEGNVLVYKDGVILGSGISLVNSTTFDISTLSNITCISPDSQNYSQSLEFLFVDVAEMDIDLPLVSFIQPTPASGTITDKDNREFAFQVNEKNLNKLIWNFDNINYSLYSGNLILQSNFENDSDFNENGFNFYDSSIYQNNGTCLNCPDLSLNSRFIKENPNDNNLLFNERFNGNLSDWTSSSYGGEISIVTKDFSKKLLLNDTASFSYISVERGINESFSNYIIEYDLLYSSASVLVMELFDSQDNLISSIDAGSTLNTISFDTDLTTPTNSSFNAGTYKQIVLSIDKNNKNIKAYLSENDATYGSLSLISSKNYSNSNISKIRFRTGQTESGLAYLDEIRIYHPVMSVIGDSITDGKRLWSTHPAYPEGRLSAVSNESSPPQYRIGNLICNNCWIGNRGFGGSTTTSVNNYIQTALLDQEFEQVYIAIGHNDLAASTSLSTMQNNFNLIINKTLASGINSSNIIIANVFPGSDLNTAGEIQNKNDWNSWLLNRSLELGAVYVDLDLALRDPASQNQIKSTYNGGDGVHLNSAGNEILAQTVANAIYSVNQEHGIRSLRFNGFNDTISFGNSQVFSSNELTLTFWANFTTNQNSSILSKKGSYEIRILDGKIQAEITTNNQLISAQSNGNYADSIWHNYAVSYNGSLLSLYVDGVLKSSNFGDGNINYSTSNLTLGSNYSSFFNGFIDELKIYNLSSSGEQASVLGKFESIKVNSTFWKYYVNQTSLQQKTYIYNVFAYDRNLLMGTESFRNLSVYYDTILPIVTIISPINVAYSDSIFINYTASDLSGINSCWYNLDNGGNVTLFGCATTSVNGLSDGGHSLNIYANDSYGNTNKSSVNFIIDSSAPLYLAAIESYPSSYSENYSYFNITWSDSSLQSVIFESNFSGISTNYSMQNLGGGIYQFYSIIPAGTFYWRTYANDSYGHQNTSQEREFTISKSNQGARIYLNGQNDNLTISYGDRSNVSVAIISGDYLLIRNGEIVSNPDITVLSAGYYNYTLEFDGSQNYSAKSVSLFLNITKIAPSLNLLFNGFDSDISVGEQLNISINASSSAPSDKVVNLYENGISIDTDNPINLIKTYSSTGQYIWNVTMDESENYTSASKSHTISVLDSNYPAYSNLKVSVNSPANYQNSRNYVFNSTWTDNVEIQDVIFEFQNKNYSLLNGEIVKNSNEYYFNFTDLAAGSYSYKWYGVDSSSNTVSTPLQIYTVEKAVGALFLSISPSNSIAYGTSINVFCVANNPESSLALTRNSALVSIPDTTLLIPNVYNYACTASASQNYTSSSATSTLTVNKATPDIILSLNGIQNNLELSSSGGLVQIAANLSLLDSSQANLTLFVNGEEIYNASDSLVQNYTFVSGINNVSISYSGNSNYNSRTLTRYVIVSAPSTPSGGGGGGSASSKPSGGGGSMVVNTQSKNKTISLEFQSLGDIIISPGESKIIEINIKNNGDIFLNKCYLRSLGGYESWIKSDTNKNINPGELTEYLFEIKVPLEANKTDEPKLMLKCLEKEFEVPIKTIILNSGMDIEIDNLELINEDKLSVNYTAIGNADFEESIIFKVYDFEDNLISEKSEKIVITSGKISYNNVLDVSGAEKGLLKVEISKLSGGVIVDEFFVYDSRQPITGFALLDKLGGNSFYIVFIGVFFLVVALLIIKRMNSVNHLKKWEDFHKSSNKEIISSKVSPVSNRQVHSQIKREQIIPKKIENKEEIKNKVNESLPRKVKWNKLFEEHTKSQIEKQSNTKLKDEIKSDNFRFETYGKEKGNSGWETY